MSDPDAPWRFRYSQATPNKEEQARLDKLAAETALVNEQLKKAQRENAAAESEAKSLTARYWFILTPAHALQAVVAGAALEIFMSLTGAADNSAEENHENDGSMGIQD